MTGKTDEFLQGYNAAIQNFICVHGESIHFDAFDIAVRLVQEAGNTKEEFQAVQKESDFHG